MNIISHLLSKSFPISTTGIRLLFVSFFLMSTIFSFSQDKKALESSKKKLENQISYTKKLLNETSSKKKASLNELSLLSKQIKNRQELIEVYNREITQANNEIGSLQKQIADLQAELVKLKANYSKLIYQSYKSHNQVDKWMYIFSADDFYQAMSRVKYIKAISVTRKEAADKILNKEVALKNRLSQYQQVKITKLELMTSKEREAKALLTDKSKKEVAVKGIVQKEQDLKRQLSQQQREWAQLNDEIKRVIAAQMKKTTTGTGVNQKETKVIPLTPEEKLVAENFAGNKGLLPWPSERGQITSSFGPHPHPQLEVTIDNKGVDIRTERGATARAVFEGKVTRVFHLGKFKAIIIQHGSYFTVYSNLSEVYVAENQKVTTKQLIGKVGTSADSGETILHFELWSSKTNSPQNPALWIKK